MLQKQDGFTVLELIITIVSAAILIALVVIVFVL